MARLTIRYKAKDSRYTDSTQTFEAENTDRCREQKKDFEDIISRDNPDGITSMYDTEVIKIEP